MNERKEGLLEEVLSQEGLLRNFEKTIREELKNKLTAGFLNLDENEKRFLIGSGFIQSKEELKKRLFKVAISFGVNKIELYRMYPDTGKFEVLFSYSTDSEDMLSKVGDVFDAKENINFENVLNGEHMSQVGVDGVGIDIAFRFSNNNVVIGLDNVNCAREFTEIEKMLIQPFASELALAYDAGNLLFKNSSDSLTKVLNRGAFDKRIENGVGIFGQPMPDPLGIVFFDIDHFKQVNDVRGHEAGDKILIGVSRVLHDYLSKVDGELYRYGGEEFVAVIPQDSGFETAQQIKSYLEEIRQYVCSLRGDFYGIGEEFDGVSFSSGVSLIKDQSTEARIQAVRDADYLVYDAKNSGRNCIKI
ncbi:GGDEF domain-containing protein [Candidatus Absconditicoccus praedator]|uniref:GGDEF domain-containing protein n=1 Tax=Candidatus Absconditicoccus praedator TaxID=2735562 RepID=UPI001E5C8205|nr:GGDEF domain-containing protein [Candidatus Absconditicoccus praedator]UFX83097.1 GGDEF domain-containing protein [Candidatus Absconditicoccus praedator]